ncbi:hypothetical protein [Streptomyces sp. NBC_01264]|uniref:hypothetical protein n=1 Tax=Streptomyces sp. NBC_01264 TaxID=2903804 RepID=UPI00224FC2F1|nr:hypothetical protein [Streptomyces sp. NBC_01264]MCX4780052.1 hypothetical protein [Streptomyces sp. NBC_01264]
MAFPQTPIELLAEMQIGGVWTDITADLYARSPLTIERGRPDEAARVDPTRATFQLDNRQNKYSPRNPSSPNYGLIGRNTPIRFSVPGTESYLSMDGGTANTSAATDHASFAVTDLDVRAELTADWWSSTLNQTIIGQWGSDGNRGWMWRLLNGNSTINWTTSGAVTTSQFATIPLPRLPRRAALRMTLDVNNGASGWTATLYQAPSLAGPWALVGTTTGVGTTSIYNSGAPLRVAPEQSDTNPPRAPFAGRGHRFELRASIGGSVVAAPDYRALPPGNSSFLDSAGRTWSFAGTAAVSNREYRCTAEVSSWPPRWDESGRDVYVPVEAAGILRRLGQGAKPLASPLRRRIPTVGNPRAYWPMEDGREAVQAYSPLPNAAPLAVTGFEFAADDSLLGSSPLPRITAGARMAGAVPSHTATGQWLVAMVFYWAAAPASPTVLLDFTTSGTASRIVLTVDSTGVSLDGYSPSNTSVFNVSALATGFGFYGAWTRLEITAEQSGGNTKFRVGWVDVSGSGFGNDGTVVATAGTVTGINTGFGALAADVRLGHLGVFASSNTTVYDRADDGWLGEAAGSRLLRLSTEEGVPLTSTSALAAMGPQRPDKLLTLLGECEASDGGVLHERRDRLALQYRSQDSLYNQPVALTLDYAQAGHVAPPLQPTDDDQRARNSVTVSRAGGSSALAVQETGPMSVLAPPDGIGVYEDARTISVAKDNQLAHIAWWRLHMGTWDEARYPTVHIDLAAAPSLIEDVLALDIGDRIQIVNPPSWLPPGPIDLIVEGWTETIGHPNSWDLVLNCSPAGPWTVAAVDSARGDTTGSVLGTGVTSTGTSLTVHTVQTDGYPPVLWTPSPADYPFDLVVGGEVVTATGPALPLAADTFTRSVGAGSWGTASDGHVWTATGGPTSDRSVAATYGVITLSATPTTNRQMTVAESCQDCDVRAAVAFSATATGASLAASLLARWTSSADYYRLRVEGTTAGGITLSVMLGTTVVGSSATGVTYTPGSIVQVRMRVIGDRVLGRVWPTAGDEPGTWHVDQTVTSSPIAEGLVGLAGSGLTGNTNVSPEIRFHDWTVLSPQRIPVTRSTNGIVKAHTAGAQVGLAQPAIAAL